MLEFSDRRTRGRECTLTAMRTTPVEQSTNPIPPRAPSPPPTVSQYLTRPQLLPPSLPTPNHRPTPSRRYALRGLLARLDAGLPVHGFPLVGDQRQHDKDSNVKDSLSNGSTASAASATATPARMSPPSASVLETARLLTLSDPQSSGFNSNEARDDGGSWGFQKFILVSEFEQGERSLDSLMGRLITVRWGMGRRRLLERRRSLRACSVDGNGLVGSVGIPILFCFHFFPFSLHVQGPVFVVRAC